MNSKKNLRQAFVFTLLILLLAGCVGATATPTPVPPTSTPVPIVTGIEGRVYFAGTDEPIPDVTILLNDPQLSGGPQQNPELTIAKTKTDSQGHYSFADIVPGTYVISLSMTSETKVSSIEVTVKEYITYFAGASKDGSIFLYIVEPKIVVSLGEIVQEDFVVH